MRLRHRKRLWEKERHKDRKRRVGRKEERERVNVCVCVCIDTIRGHHGSTSRGSVIRSPIQALIGFVGRLSAFV